MRMNYKLHCPLVARQAISPASRCVIFITLAALLMLVAACDSKPTNNAASKNVAPASPTPAPAAQPAQGGGPETYTMEVNKSVMVTEELDLGKPVPTIAQG